MENSVDFTHLSPHETLYNVGMEAAPNHALSAPAKALKVLLLEPLYPSASIWGSFKASQGHQPPMGMVSLYAYLKHRGYNVELIDTQFGDYNTHTLAAHLASKGYDVVGLSVFTATAEYAFQTARLVKQALPHCKLVMGNIHVTSLPELSMEQCPEIDFIVRHEGEYSLDEFLSALANGAPEWSKIDGLVFRQDSRVVINPQRPFIGNLDALPTGFYADMEMARYVPHATQYLVLPNYPVITQRGCPNACTYCEAARILGKKPRCFSPQRIVEELKILKYEKGARGIYFQDSTFTLNKKWTMTLMELMIQANLGLLWSCNTRADCVTPELLAAMYAAGGRQIFMGIESGNQQSLDIVKKGTTVERQTQGVAWVRQAGFRYYTSFIICLPGETPEMVDNTIRYAKMLGAHTSMFYLPVPYPGTVLYQQCKKDGGLRLTGNWSDFLAVDFENPVYINPHFGKEGMRYYYKRAYIEYYRSPRVWLKNVMAIRTRQDVARLLRGGRGLASMVTHGFWRFLGYQPRRSERDGAQTAGEHT